MERKIKELEKLVHLDGCTTCRDWPPIAVVMESRGDTMPEQVCPSCGREATKVIHITRREDGPL